ncbi:MAG: alkaline phosphatase family protein [Candidatus Bathyarchaeota archaeon]
MTKVFLFGIDGSAPNLIFNEWINDLPNIRRLMKTGAYAKMNSTIPPVTIIAWSAIASGKDASQIGAFSYTIRDPETNKSKIVSSKQIKTDMIWDILSKQNKRTVSLNVPLTYPVKPINGVMVSGFLTPGIDSNCAYPEDIKEKIKLLGNYETFFDISGMAGYKSMDLDVLLKRTYEMTNMQIALLKDLIVNEEWDFFMQVIIGSDRLQHMLWRHFDKTHRRFIANSEYKNSLKDYYIFLDGKLGEILEIIHEKLGDDVVVIVASDHGMVKQEGKININNWMMEKGYLILKEEFKKETDSGKTRMKFEGIDLDRTAAYATGAYHARIFINKAVVGEDYEGFRRKLIEELKAIPDDKGQPLKTEVFKAEETYAYPEHPECPDLTVYFDELRWAANPDFGMFGLYSWESAFGADNAGHSMQGCFIISGKGIKAKGDLGEVEIYQLAPTILQLVGVPVPKDIKHKPIAIN